MYPPHTIKKQINEPFARTKQKEKERNRERKEWAKNIF
jgi:hypothetical protein